MSYTYNPQLGRVVWTPPNQQTVQPQTSTVNVSALSPAVSATPVYSYQGGGQSVALAQHMQPSYMGNVVQTNPGTIGVGQQATALAAQAVPALGGTVNPMAANGIGGALQQSNSLALAQNARPDFWSLEGAFGSKNGAYAGWANSAINGLTALGGLYFGYQNLRLQKKALAEQTALQRANYRNQAKTLNAQYRDQLSGRGYNGMTDTGKQALGREYANRRVSETY